MALDEGVFIIVEVFAYVFILTGLLVPKRATYAIFPFFGALTAIFLYLSLAPGAVLVGYTSTGTGITGAITQLAYVPAFTAIIGLLFSFLKVTHKV